MKIHLYTIGYAIDLPMYYAHQNDVKLETQNYSRTLFVILKALHNVYLPLIDILKASTLLKVKNSLTICVILLT